jgi:hypothetical protein
MTQNFKNSNLNISLQNSQKCPICYSFYSSQIIALVLNCGHSFCSKCMKKMFNEEEKFIKCAFDKKILEYPSIEDIPVNFSLMQLLQAISLLRINNNCNFSSNLKEYDLNSNINENQIINRKHTIPTDIEDGFKCTVEEFSFSKTILELKFIQNHPQINYAKEIVYDISQNNLNGGTIFQKFYENKKFMNIKKKLYDNGEYFEGIYVNNKKHGWGKRRSQNGVLFEGFYISGSKEGFGIEIYKNGDIFLGEFENNLKSGEGILLYNHQIAKFKGRFFMNKKHGPGEEILYDNSEYKGEYSNGMRSGQGCITYPNGNFIKGEFQNGKLTGEGKEQTDIYRYKGSFREGLKHGYGIIVYSNGNMYKGNFQENKFHGQGSMKYSNGNIYEGSFLDGKKHGKGTFKLASKEDPKIIFLIYSGDFIDNLYDGQGSLTLINKYTTIYEGGFNRGLKKGFGVLRYSNGDEFRGMFDRDMKNGPGEIFYSDTRRIIKGLWKNNRLVYDEFKDEENENLPNLPESELDDISIYN